MKAKAKKKKRLTMNQLATRAKKFLEEEELKDYSEQEFEETLKKAANPKKKASK
ncbi:MAG TPA: hypothetical protein VKT28_13075 [Puia sp.]|nr:hypothetical protein [Puia sp.]